jgi:predicted transcriptional regulator
MPVRRSTLGLILAVLIAIKDGCDKPTRIMYTCNMSWKPMKRLLGRLVEKGYVLEVEYHGNKRSRKRYVISERGKSVLRYFEEAQDQLGVDVPSIIT